MDDLISRIAALVIIRSLYPSKPFMERNQERWRERYKHYIEAEEALKRLPSAQRKTGKWTQSTSSFAFCNQCGEPAPYWAMSSKYYLTNYCPNCGARMQLTEER